jgi:phosphoribosylaminoimidazole (AIR) synthetase
MTANRPLSYSESGVDYAKIDPLKILAQQAAKETARNLLKSGFSEVEACGTFNMGAGFARLRRNPLRSRGRPRHISFATD